MWPWPLPQTPDFFMGLPGSLWRIFSQVILKSRRACNFYAPDTGFVLTQSVTLTFEWRALSFCTTHHPVLVKICTKLFCKPSKNEWNIDWTNPIFSFHHWPLVTFIFLETSQLTWRTFALSYIKIHPII
jgi:hypothetical protein